VLVLSATPFALVPRVMTQGARSGLGDVKDAAKAYALLKNLSSEAVSFDPKLGHDRISISRGIVVYDFAAAPRAAVVSRPDRLTPSLEVMIRAGVLGRDFRACMPGETFWVAPLDHIQNLAEKMVDAVYSTGSETETQTAEQAYNAQVQAEFAALEKELLLYAHNARLDVRGSRGSVEGYGWRVGCRNIPLHLTSAGGSTVGEVPPLMSPSPGSGDDLLSFTRSVLEICSR